MRHDGGVCNYVISHTALCCSLYSLEVGRGEVDDATITPYYYRSETLRVLL